MTTSRVPTDPNLSREMRRFLDNNNRDFDSLVERTANLTQIESISGLIKLPVNQDYRIVERTDFPLTLERFTTKLASGSATVTLKIGSTAVTGGAINTTSTQASAALTAANVAPADSVIVLTVSSVSSPVDLSFSIRATKTLDV